MRQRETELQPKTNVVLIYCPSHLIGTPLKALFKSFTIISQASHRRHLIHATFKKRTFLNLRKYILNSNVVALSPIVT